MATRREPDAKSKWENNPRPSDRLINAVRDQIDLAADASRQIGKMISGRAILGLLVLIALGTAPCGGAFRPKARSWALSALRRW
jgi:hypothetical protein